MVAMATAMACAGPAGAAPPDDKDFSAAVSALVAAAKKDQQKSAVTTLTKSLVSASEVARRIDKMIGKKWNDANVKPTNPVSDAEFVRRAYLDITGKIPPAMVARKFIADTYGDKREKLVKKLLNSPNYVRHFTNVWRARLLPETEADFQLRYVSVEFDAWMRKKLLNNEKYDQIVRQIITVPLRGRGTGAYAFYDGRGDPKPTAFYSAKEIKPENLGAATARVFLGLRVDCAQCHDPPFASWKQENFWSYAAFFSGIRSRTGGAGVVQNLTEFFGFKKGEKRTVSIMIPDKNKSVNAAFLDGSTPTADSLSNPRKALADWITKKDNPYFTRAAVNRMWHHFFGMGIVDPVDDLGGTNEPSHPKVLNYLSSEFAAHEFDLKFLIQTITSTRAYQLSSKMTHPSQTDRRVFARMTPKAMTADQLYDSLAAAAGTPNDNPSENIFVDTNLGSRRGQFRQMFAQSGDNPADRETSVMQALMIMNGNNVARATNLRNSQTLYAVARMPLMTPKDRIDSLYLAALSRYPTKSERKKMLAYVKKGGVRKSRREAFWVLLNSSEFMLNH